MVRSNYKHVGELWDEILDKKEEPPAQMVELPDGSNYVKAIGYKNGLRALYIILPADVIQTNYDLSGPFITNAPVEISEIEKTGRRMCIEALLLGGVYTTNNTEQFVDLYAENFVNGYKFSQFAIPRGLFNIYRSLPFEKSHEAAFNFALKLYQFELPDEVLSLEMVEALDKIDAIYKQYQALN